MRGPLVSRFAVLLFFAIGTANGQVCYQFTAPGSLSSQPKNAAVTVVVRIPNLPTPTISVVPGQVAGGATYNFTGGRAAGYTATFRVGSKLWGEPNLTPVTLNTFTTTGDSATTTFVLHLEGTDSKGADSITITGILPTPWSANNYAPPASLPAGTAFRLTYYTGAGYGDQQTNSAIGGCSEIQDPVGRPSPNDLTGGGISSPLVWRPSNGTWFNAVAPPFPIAVAWGASGDVPIPGDYDGDGKSDYAIWRPSLGEWYVIFSSTGQGIIVPWGSQGDIPIGASDFDGDGKADYAVWRPSEGVWYVILSSTGQASVTPWGAPGDIPIGGTDFDGDGKADYAIYRPSSGEWYVLLSGTGTAQVVPFGSATDIPMPGDFNGDGITDYAFWRPSQGTWYWLDRGNVTVFQWGAPGDIPIQGDFNGDCRADYAIFRPSTSEWWISYNEPFGTISTPQAPVPWGSAGDFPVGETLLSPP